MKKHYRAILLVLAHEVDRYNPELYKFFKKVYELYLDTNPNIKVFFTYAGKITFTPNEYDLVYPEVIETPIQPHATTKVINAMEYIDNNYSYDFLIRTNLSTFWNFESLLNRLDALPDKLCFSGHRGMFSPPMVTGIGMIISKDIISKIIEHKNLINLPYNKQYIAEDRLISDFITNYLNVKIIPAYNVFFIEKLTTTEVDDYMETIIIKATNLNVDHFRIKNLANRQAIDAAVMSILLKTYYNKIIIPALNNIK